MARIQKRRIGILTFHCAHNYGAVLQAYALQQKLIGMGHQVEIIDYRPWYIVNSFKFFSWKKFQTFRTRRKIKHLLSTALNFRSKLRRIKKFEKFINTTLQLSQRVTKSNHDSLTHEIFVFGSDQIWSPKITRGDDLFFGEFKGHKNSKKITYAASMGHVNSSLEEHLDKLVRNFEMIGVRETDLAELIQPQSKKKIQTVLDPTLIVNKEVWGKISVKPKIDRKYVLIYQVRISKNTRRIAKDVAKQLDAIVLEVEAWPSLIFDRHTLKSSSPEEFLGLIENAACIITTSFHGTAFSIVYNKPFYTVKLNDEGDNRSLSLLKNLGLENRMIAQDSDPVFEVQDFEKANGRLSDLRKTSDRFLEESIQ